MQIAKTALLPFNCSDLFELVNDIESYPTFLEGCVGSEIIEQSPEQITAKLQLKKAGFADSFTTRNTLIANQSIDMELVSGPFSKLSGFWRFEPIGDKGCRISFELTFSIGGHLMNRFSEKIFAQVGNKMVASISEEAYRRYQPNL